MTRIFLPAFCIALGFIPFSSALAQEKAEGEKKTSPVVEAYDAFTKDFNDMDKRHFGVMYGNYNMVKVVETVRGSVDSAVKACGEKNPDMKEPLDTRFGKWKAAVEPVLKEAEVNINNMTFAQSYAPPEKIKEMFKLVDDTRAEQDSKVDKVPVTTPEACDFLLKQMDETQDNMVKLLNATLISLPHSMIEEDQKAAEEAKPAEAAPANEAPAEKPAE